MKINWKATPLPTYGNFGGQQISGEDGAPVDSLDELFQAHDAEILAASQDVRGADTTGTGADLRRPH